MNIKPLNDFYSADQSAKSWHSRDQKCVKTLDVSSYRNECRDNSKVNVSPPLLHTLTVLSLAYVAMGAENGSIIINRLEGGKLSTAKTATKVYSGAHSNGIGALAARSVDNGHLFFNFLVKKSSKIKQK